MPTPSGRIEDERTGMTRETLTRAVVDHLRFTRAKDLASATLLDIYFALSHTVRDRLVHRWIETQRTYREQDVKRVYYLSAEYLLGRQLEANMLNLGLYGIAEQGLAERGIDLQRIFECEPDPGLGNGGLGRLAACFMDSLATLALPGMGYGIRYEFGIFRQEIEGGWQVEQPDEWLRMGNPWEIRRPERQVLVGFGGTVEHSLDGEGRFQARWVPAEHVVGMPYDVPVAGYRNNTVHSLRLWAAQASESFDLAVFNDGDYRRAVERKALSESISKVLYPKDDSPEGKELRLRQQYFFVCCSIHDIVRRYKLRHDGFDAFPERAAIQLNDTHPAIAVAELMRVFLDEEGLEWDPAWALTRAATGYTNHTLLPEALETWSVELFGRLLPRHLELIYEINRRFLRDVQIAHPQDVDLLRRVSLIDERGGKFVRMAHLATVGAHTVNGVAQLHGQLLRDTVLADFARLFPDRFTAITNGVTPRRFVLQWNHPLARAISERIGTEWITDLGQLDRLEDLIDDPTWHAELAAIKRTKKEQLATVVQTLTGVELDPSMLFDVQVKRIHEYKRQLMLCLYVVHLYVRARLHGELPAPRAVVFGGKAAPGYAMAKKHIKLIHDVAATINHDPALQGRLKLVFLPNYNVSLAGHILPAADLSEQISLAGKEASGTGNMKFQMNGALTIGTLDGANVEIREAVGPDNFFLFGLDTAGVRARRAAGYHPADAIAADPALGEVLDLIDSGFFEPAAVGVHREIVAHLRQHDPYLIAADFADYCRAQGEAAATYSQPEQWWPKVAANIARSGWFSSDRTIAEYAERIWGLTPCSVDVPDTRLDIADVSGSSSGRIGRPG